jgi:hypothetical protein
MTIDARPLVDARMVFAAGEVVMIVTVQARRRRLGQQELRKR